MRRLVLYYSNTGNTQKVAKALADALGAELAEVRCPAYLQWFGPIAMAWQIFSRRLPTVESLVLPHSHYDLVVVGGPVWAAHAAPPIMSVLKRRSFDASALALFVTCNGSASNSPPEPAIADMKDAAAQTPVLGTAIFREADIRSPRFADRITAFASQLTGGGSVPPA